MKKTILAFACAACGTLSAVTDAELDAIVRRMTVEEKAGQLTQLLSSKVVEGVVMTTDSGGAKPTEEAVGWVTRGEVGSLLGACGIETFNAYQRIAVEESRLKIPLMIGHDMIHGVLTQFPVPLALSCTWDENDWFEAGRLIALETPLKGCNWTFTPMLDMSRDPRWGRIVESPGQDPYLGSRFAAAMVRGIQSKDVAMPVAACLKHYLGYGAPFGGRDYNSVEMSESTLRNIYLPPFRAGVAAGALTVMPSFNTLNGVPLSVNKWLLTDVLRDELGFAGFTISDWGAISQCGWNGQGMAADKATLGKLALEAGMDQDMMANIYGKELPGLVRAGKLDEKLLDRSVRRILGVKNALGLWEKPYIDEKAVRAQVDLKRHAARARAVAAKGCVLLKNEKDVLPLKPGLKVALVGPGAEDEKNLSGAWTSFIENKSEMFITEGLRGAGVDFTYTPGYDFTKPGVDAAALGAAAARADVIVAIFGEHGRESGEGWSKMSVELPAVQREALAVLKATGKPLVALLTNGRPLAIPELANEADAILEAWSGGTSAGGAIADVLTGKVNPEGRLTTEFPVATGQLPLYYNRDRTGHYTDNPSPFTSCYRDGPYQALYPFGFGLSYASFAYADEQLRLEGEGADRQVVLSCKVTNTGKVAGVETVQVYTRQRVGVESRPIRELKAWRKVALSPGETKLVEVKVPVSELAYWARNRLVPASGPMEAWICRDSVSGEKLKFEL